MADRMNIKFTIQAVDRFSKTMNNLERKLDSIQRKADSLDLSRRVDIDVDTAQAASQLSALQQQIDSLGGGNADIDVNVDSAGANLELARIRAATEAMNSARIRVEVDADVARARLARLEQQRDSLNDRPAVINVVVQGYKQFRTNMDRIATTGRNVGEIVANTFMGIATTFSTTLVPIIASTTGMLGSLGVMIGTTAGATMGLLSAFVGAGAAAGGFAIVAIPAIKHLNEHVKAVKDSQEKYQTALRQGNEKQAAKYLAEYNYALSQMSTEQRKAMENMDKFKASFKSLTDEMEPGVLNVYAGSLQAVTTMLAMGRPMIEASVDAVQRLTSAFNANLKADDVKAFFDFLNTSGAASLQIITQALGNFLQGFLNMMVAFGPLATDMQGGFLRMSEGFRAWSAALGENSRFQAFVQYVRENWPAVRTIIGTAIAAIIETFAGFSSYASDWMATTQALIDKWRAFAQGMGENEKFQAFLDYTRTNAPKVTAMIGNMIEFLVALGVALAPVGAVMVEVASAIFQFMTNLLQANPEIGHLLGWILALGGGFFTLLPAGIAIFSMVSTLAGIFRIFAPTISRVMGAVTRLIPGFARLRTGFVAVRAAMMLMGGPVMWIIGILLLLVPVFVKLWKENEKFRAIVTSVWDAIKNAISTAIAAISSYVMSVWGTLVAWWAQNGEMIKQAATNVWNAISTVITTAMTIIAAIIKFVWPAVLLVITSVWNNIKGVISGALEMIMGIITIFGGLFTGNFGAMWEGVKQLFMGAVQFLWNAVQLLLWGKLLKGVLVFAGMFRTGIVALWNGAKTLFMNGVNAVKSVFMTGFNAIKSFLDNIWTHIYVRVDDAMIAMRTKVTAGLNAIKTFFYNIWVNIYVHVGDAMIKMRTLVQAGMTAVKNFFVNAWTTIYVKVSDALIRLRTAATNAFNTIRSAVTSFVSNIVSKITSGFGKIVSFVRGAFDDIAYVARIVSAGIRGTISDFISAITMRVRVGFNMIKNNITTAMSSAKSAVSNAWNSIKSAVSSAISNIVSTVRSKFQSIVSAIGAKMTAVKSKVSQGWASVMSFLRGIDLAGIGRQMIQGLINGITGMAGKLVSSAKGVVEGAINGAKKLLGIKSPSRVFKEIGMFTMLGMQGGIQSEATRTINAVTKVADAMTKAFAPELEAAMNVTGGYGRQNGYADASTSYAQARSARASARAAESRTVVEVPVYLNGREIAKASNEEQKRMNAREEARIAQFSRTGGA